jgi:uncharacterized protein YndB with AHSA1/START domain
MDTEYGSIEKQIRVDGQPQVVYDMSSPEHIKAWWFDEADFEADNRQHRRPSRG